MLKGKAARKRIVRAEVIAREAGRARFQVSGKKLKNIAASSARSTMPCLEEEGWRF